MHQNDVQCESYRIFSINLDSIGSSWEFNVAILVYCFLIFHSTQSCIQTILFLIVFGYVCLAVECVECVASIQFRLAKPDPFGFGYVSIVNAKAKYCSSFSFYFILAFGLLKLFEHFIINSSIATISHFKI